MALFKKKIPFAGGGLTLFQDVHDAMAAENVLRKAGYSVRLVAPPPRLRRGCDLAVAVNLVEKPGIERTLRERNVNYVEVLPLQEDAAILETVRTTDFGEYLMVKAANMKLTLHKESGVIVNTSGGGCPDIPYLHAKLIDCAAASAPRPRDMGFTLCALMLDRALEEAIALQKGDV